MRALVDFFRLPGRDRGLLVRAAILVVVVRLALWTRPFEAVRTRLDAWSGSGRNRSYESRAPHVAPVERVTWSVRVASRLVPDATCLTQALAAHALLGRTGRASDVRFGVARGASGSLEAHAWLEVDGDVVLGRLPDLERYTPLGERRGSNP